MIYNLQLIDYKRTRKIITENSYAHGRIRFYYEQCNNSDILSLQFEKQELTFENHKDLHSSNLQTYIRTNFMKNVLKKIHISTENTEKNFNHK